MYAIPETLAPEIGTLLRPSALSGLQLETEIRTALRQSLEWCLAQVTQAFANYSEATPEIPGIPDNWHPLPADYGAYYDLVRLLTAYGYFGEYADEEPFPRHKLSESSELCELLARFRSAFAGADSNAEKKIFSADLPLPSVTTLSSRFYSTEDIDRLIRWIDLEPENAMDLAPLGGLEFDAARHNVEQALTALREWAPAFFAEMSVVLNEIIVAKSGGNQRLTFRGASSFALWGAIAVNSEKHPLWWTLLPTLVHETGHNILFGLARHSPLVLNDPALRYASPLRADPRPMDGIYHAAFVSAREVVAMEDCLKNMPGSLDIPNQEEIRAFLETTHSASLQAFHDCATILDREAQLTELGNDILQELQATLFCPTSLEMGASECQAQKQHAPDLSA